jgi:hypothetical protein
MQDPDGQFPYTRAGFFGSRVLRIAEFRLPIADWRLIDQTATAKLGARQSKIANISGGIAVGLSYRLLASA